MSCAEEHRLVQERYRSDPLADGKGFLVSGACALPEEEGYRQPDLCNHWASPLPEIASQQMTFFGHLA
jgi:hypothetical protein